MVGNGHSLAAKFISSSTIESKCLPRSQLAIKNLLHIPNITKNLPSLSKFSKDNKVYFKFHANKYFIESKASNLVSLEGFLDESRM